MTGWDEASKWIEANAPTWALQSAKSYLVPGVRAGSPTERRFEVILVPVPEPVEADGTWYPSDIWLKADGDTLLEAVMQAVGGVR